jgi:hypothetical protein
MKQRKRKTTAAPTPRGEADDFNAREALNQGSGHEPLLGEYVRDLAEVLKVVTRHLDPDDKHTKGLQLRFVDQDHRTVSAKKRRANLHEDEEWEGNFLQVQAAIENGSSKALSWYFHGAAEVLSKLGALLDPPEGHKGWRLELVRKGRGRRSDPSKFWRDSGIAHDLMMRTISAGKQEAAVVEVEDDRMISRATVFRAKKRSSKESKKSRKKR